MEEIGKKQLRHIIKLYVKKSNKLKNKRQLNIKLIYSKNSLISIHTRKKWLKTCKIWRETNFKIPYTSIKN